MLLTLIEDVLEQFRGTIDGDGTDYYSYKNVHRSFEYFKRYDAFALDLYKFGYGSLLLEKLNQFHEEVAGTMQNSSIEKYGLYMYMGALFNTAVMWLQNGAKESEEDIADMFCRWCGILPYRPAEETGEKVPEEEGTAECQPELVIRESR